MACFAIQQSQNIKLIPNIRMGKKRKKHKKHHVINLKKQTCSWHFQLRFIFEKHGISIKSPYHCSLISLFFWGHRSLPTPKNLAAAVWPPPGRRSWNKWPHGARRSERGAPSGGPLFWRFLWDGKHVLGWRTISPSFWELDEFVLDFWGTISELVNYNLLVLGWKVWAKITKSKFLGLNHMQ